VPPNHLLHIPIRGAKSTNHIDKKEQEEKAGADGEVYEPSREPVGTARSKIKHRCCRERKRVKGNSSRSFSIDAKGVRLGCDARRKITWRQRERANFRVLCVDDFASVSRKRKQTKGRGRGLTERDKFD